MTNRYVSPSADGGIVFTPGRRYRLVVVVNGACDVEDLEHFLASNAFAEFASSTPDDWEETRPGDWPGEALPPMAVNECPVRISCVYAGDHPVKTERDMPIGKTGASCTIVQAWDYGAAGPATTGAAAPATASKDRSPLAFVGAAIAGLVGLSVWQRYSQEKRMERARTQMLSAESKAERLAVEERMSELMSGGLCESDARARVDRELQGTGAGPANDDARVIYIMG